MKSSIVFIKSLKEEDSETPKIQRKKNTFTRDF